MSLSEFQKVYKGLAEPRGNISDLLTDLFERSERSADLYEDLKDLLKDRRHYPLAEHCSLIM